MELLKFDESRSTTVVAEPLLRHTCRSVSKFQADIFGYPCLRKAALERALEGVSHKHEDLWHGPDFGSKDATELDDKVSWYVDK